MESVFHIVCGKLLRYAKKVSEPDKVKHAPIGSHAISTCTLVQ